MLSASMQLPRNPKPVVAKILSPSLSPRNLYFETKSL